MELDKQLRVAEAYDKAEAARGAQLGYEPDYNFALNALGGGTNIIPPQYGQGNGLVPHFTDAGKLPNHVTFSDQAVLDSGNGGHWVERSQSPTGEDTFYPSPQQLRGLGYLDKLQRYFDHEKGNGIDKVIVPPPYKNIEQ
jgi:hypothetical protein